MDTLYVCILHFELGPKYHSPVESAVHCVCDDSNDGDRHAGAGREHADGHHGEFDRGGDQHDGGGGGDNRSMDYSNNYIYVARSLSCDGFTVYYR